MKVEKWLVFILLVCVTSFVQAEERVKGNGTLATKQKEITDYHSIKANGVMDITYEQSDRDPFLEITVDENLQPYILAEIKDRTLTIGFQKGIKVDHFTKFMVKTNSKWIKEARIEGNANFVVESPLSGDEIKIKGLDNSLIQLKKPITLVKLELNVSGSANMVVEDLQVDKLECTINGSGSINMKKGKATEGTYSVFNQGDIHALGVAVQKLSCNITGGGLAEVYATENLKGSLIGNGTIRYKGVTPIQMTKIGKGVIEEIKE